MEKTFVHVFKLQDALRAIFAERFTILKVYLFYFNVTSDQLGEFSFIHQYICSLVMGLEAAERVSDSLARDTLGNRDTLGIRKGYARDTQGIRKGYARDT